MLTNFRALNIIQIGAGGTGSWLVPSLLRFLTNINNRMSTHLVLSYVLCDDDTVEDRNIIRQNFDEHDIDQLKASVLLRKNAQFNINKYWLAEKINTSAKFKKLLNNKFGRFFLQRRSLTIVLGCVDNNISRRAVFNGLKNAKGGWENESRIYIDSGNNLNNGQIVTSAFGCGNLIKRGETVTERIEAKRRIFQNSETFKNPKFLQMFPLNPEAEETNESCAFFGDQSQGVNIFAANLLFNNIQKILIEGFIPPNMIQFNNMGHSSFEI